MIKFIEEKERELQAAKMSDNQLKTDVVKSTLDELERLKKNEDK